MRRVEGYMAVVGMESLRVGCEQEGKSTGLAHPLPPRSCPLALRPTGWQGVRRGGMLDSFESWCLGHWETGLGPGPPSAHLPHETRANVLVFSI